MGHLGPRLPPELCENVIESLHPPDDGSPYTPDHCENQRILTLVSCTQVRRSWKDCAEKHLYSLVLVNTATALWNLRSTLQSRPNLIGLINRLVVAPRVWQSLEMPITDYLPIVPFLSMGSPVRHIQLTNVLWNPALYKGLYQSGFSNQSVVRLEIVGVAFSSLIDVIPLISSFRNITHLTLAGCYFKNHVTDHELMQLQTLPSSYASTSLRSLEVGGEDRGISGMHLFGNNIESFRLILQIGVSIPPLFDHYCASVTRYTTLKSLRLKITPLAPMESSVEDGAKAWDTIHHYLLRLLRSVTSPMVQTLEIEIVPQQQDPPLTQDPAKLESIAIKGPWSLWCRYHHTRLGLIGTLFSSDLRSVLAGPTFAQLGAFRFAVSEHVRDKDSWKNETWDQEVNARIGLRAGVFRADVDRSDESAYTTLWGNLS